MKIKSCLLASLAMLVGGMQGDAFAVNHKKCHSCDHKHKPKCSPTSIFEPIIITQPGPYCLARDIVGSIVIASNSVTLDLNSHTIFGSIVTHRSNDLTIKNGLVINSGGLAMSISNSSGVTVQDVQVTGSDQALALNNCQNSKVDSFRAYNNINTFVDPDTGAGTALVLVNNCMNVKLNDVEANSNTKALTDIVGTTDPGIGIICVFDSSGIVLTNCSANNNTRTNNNSRFAPIVALFSENVSMIGCQANSNNIVVADSRGFTPIQVRACLDTILDNCQANENTIPVSTLAFLRPIYVVASPRVIIKNCQVDDNSCELLAVSPATNSDLSGIFCADVIGDMNDIVISQCQVSGNVVTDGGAARPGPIEGQLVGITLLGRSSISGDECRAVINECQINSNIMLSNGPFNFVVGLDIAAADTTLTNCSVNDNSGGVITFGILALGNPNSNTVLNPLTNTRIINCQANNNSSDQDAFGIFIGGTFDSISGLTGTSNNCVIRGCQANGNTATTAHGIALVNALGCSVVDCQADANSSTGFFAGSTALPFGTLTANRDCSISNCSAKGNGANGFEIDASGINDDFLVQDNVAMGNVGVGFLHSPATLTSRYLGNYAKNNGTNYSITGGAIQRFSLNSSGIYTNVTGDAVHFSELINIEGI